jgi:hypothetical protein
VPPSKRVGHSHVGHPVRGSLPPGLGPGRKYANGLGPGARPLDRGGSCPRTREKTCRLIPLAREKTLTPWHAAFSATVLLGDTGFPGSDPGRGTFRPGSGTRDEPAPRPRGKVTGARPNGTRAAQPKCANLAPDGFAGPRGPGAVAPGTTARASRGRIARLAGDRLPPVASASVQSRSCFCLATRPSRGFLGRGLAENRGARRHSPRAAAFKVINHLSLATPSFHPSNLRLECVISAPHANCEHPHLSPRASS